MKNVKKPSLTKSYGKIRKVQNITLVNIDKVNSKLKEINLNPMQSSKQRLPTVEIFFINLYLLNSIQSPQQSVIKRSFQPPTPKIRAVLRKFIRSLTLNL